ncbi:MAG: hypothetical protein ACJA0H_000613 [Francisellaceae bacterium]|jgi:hypothetical protein
MVSRGLTISNGKKVSFDWNIKVRNTTFSLAIAEFDPSFIKLPIVTFKYIPPDLPSTLIHVNPDQTLCYLDKSDVYLDPYKPGAALDYILNAIEETLDKIVDDEAIKNDFVREFDAYWRAHDNCYLLTKEKEIKAKFFDSKNILDNSTSKEWLIFDDKDEVRNKNWLNKRGFLEHIREVPVITVRFTEMPKLPASIVVSTWPPRTWQSFFNWLSNYHSLLSNELMRRLCEGSINSLQQLVLFSVPNIDGTNSSWFAVRVKFTKRIQELAKRYVGSRKPGKKNKKVSPDTVRTMFKRDLTTTFYRLCVQDASTDFVLNRNLPEKIITNKKIAIIGCGTIGATTANLLVKIGAGCGDAGKISLFDKDTLKTANIGRHLLGEEYLGESKSQATKHYLQKKYSWEPNITAYNIAINSVDAFYELMKNNDLIIDATGEEQFSSFISHHYRRALQSQSKVSCSVLYGWIDANGLAIRTLLDDGKYGCYRCMLYIEDGALKERFPLIGKNKEWPTYAQKHFACGESFTPYSEGVSYSAAGLIQAMVIDYFSGNPSPRFRHQGFHKSIPLTKSQNMTSLEGCPCCG